MLSGPIREDTPLRGGIIAAIVANLAAYVYVSSQIPGLPELMPLHFNGQGVVDLIGPPGDLFKLPVIGTLVLVTNLVIAVALLPRERPAAHVLVWIALAVQLVLGSGAWVLVQRAAGE